ncbi:hypothetical protein XYCOK13_16010 [Xylanibacillus composti]|uniref:Uncharacterized protein n=1 Tax=Xylanibacillus composti TaxID=1572762 RepID=A0A8J4H0P9_9BACL|nr:hypothetical protein XYCOK13_16010 [Xylanibacillus composti]
MAIGVRIERTGRGLPIRMSVSGRRCFFIQCIEGASEPPGKVQEPFRIGLESVVIVIRKS